MATLLFYQMFEYKDEPWRSLYLTYDTLTTLLLRKPFWWLISLPPFLRPRPSWTWKRSVIVREMACRMKVVKRSVMARKGEWQPAH